MIPSTWLDSNATLHSAADWQSAVTLCGLPLSALVRGSRGYICPACASYQREEAVCD